MYIYILIQRQRKREREGKRKRETEKELVFLIKFRRMKNQNNLENWIDMFPYKNSFILDWILLQIQIHYRLGDSPYIYLPNPSAQVGRHTRSIFKQCLAGLNSFFSLSQTSYHIRVKELIRLCYLPIAEGRIVGFIFFPWVLALCENANNFIQDLNSCRQIHFLRRKPLQYKYLHVDSPYNETGLLNFLYCPLLYKDFSQL